MTSTEGMRVTVNREALAKLVIDCLPFVERKTTIPILANFMLRAEAGQLTMQATDLDTSIIKSLDCDVKHEGTITVPARKLSDTLKKLGDLPATEITLSVLDNWITLACGDFKVKLPGMDTANYPSLPKPPKTVATTIAASVLSGLIMRTRYAISNEESRYTLNGALLIASLSGVTMVATDGHRLARVTHDDRYAGPGFKVLLTRDCLDRLHTLLDKAKGGVEVLRDEGKIFFRSDAWTIISRELTGQFPNYDAVLPNGTHHHVLTVTDSKALNAAVARVAQFANDRCPAIAWSMGPDGLKLSAKSETGEASQIVTGAQYEGAPMTCGFQSNYVLDFLKSVNGGGVTLRLRDNQSSGMFQPINDEGYNVQTVIMPVRI